jgi:hypothetical protein
MFAVPVIAPIFAALVVASVFMVLVVAPIFIVPKALYLRLSLIALYHVSKGIKSIGEIPDTAYSPSNKLLTQGRL